MIVSDKKEPYDKCKARLIGKVLSINSDEVTIGYGNNYYFLYINKKYLSDEFIDSDYYMEYVGNYEYNSVSNEKRRIASFKETNIKFCNK